MCLEARQIVGLYVLLTKCKMIQELLSAVKTFLFVRKSTRGNIESRREDEKI